ncbi:Nipped-B-like protein B [Durusdinium trenchii]|uniref:Nipped-B-like protein B n=1 Tax=Durusdinium trenchii TaxID=1381693 RepID=A0ABP0RT17_9DINO
MSNDLPQNEFLPENVDFEYEVPDYLLDPLKYYEAPGEELEFDEEHGYGPEQTYELAPEEVNFIEKTLQEKRDPTSEMSKNLQRRLDAETQYRKMQARAKISRALNAKPDRTTQYIPGDLVYYRRPWHVKPECQKILFSEDPATWKLTGAFACRTTPLWKNYDPLSLTTKSDKVTAQEMNQARALLGAMQWRSIQTGPQHSSKVSWLQSALPKGGKDVLHQINKLSREMHQRYLSVSTRQLGAESVDDIGFVCYTDAAVANRPNFASTGGHLVGMVHRSYLQGKKGFVNPISWRSHKLVLLLVCRSAGHGRRSELNGQNFLDDLLTFYAQRTALLWVASDSQLADGLTKGSASEMLTRFFQGHQVWAASFDPEFSAEFDEDLSWRGLVARSHPASSGTFHEEFLGHVSSVASAFEGSLQGTLQPLVFEDDALGYILVFACVRHSVDASGGRGRPGILS